FSVPSWACRSRSENVESKRHFRELYILYIHMIQPYLNGTFGESTYYLLLDRRAKQVVSRYMVPIQALRSLSAGSITGEWIILYYLELTHQYFKICTISSTKEKKRDCLLSAMLAKLSLWIEIPEVPGKEIQTNRIAKGIGPKENAVLLPESKRHFRELYILYIHMIQPYLNGTFGESTYYLLLDRRAKHVVSKYMVPIQALRSLSAGSITGEWIILYYLELTHQYFKICTISSTKEKKRDCLLSAISLFCIIYHRIVDLNQLISLGICVFSDLNIDLATLKIEVLLSLVTEFLNMKKHSKKRKKTLLGWDNKEIRLYL
ncbi:hypothetical protein ACJX0J_016238, partial [Zea mays]